MIIENGNRRGRSRRRVFVWYYIVEKGKVRFVLPPHTHKHGGMRRACPRFPLKQKGKLSQRERRRRRRNRMCR